MEMTTTKSMKVPKCWEGPLAALIALTDGFCDEHLDHEYAELARYAIAALCRKRPSPLTNGHSQTWACAVLYALGQVNFLSDRSTAPYMAMADLCGYFGIALSTGGNKAKLVRTALSMHQFDHNWTLPSRLESSSLSWLIEVDGLIVDARQLPVDMQEVAVQKGLIPFVYKRISETQIETDLCRPGHSSIHYNKDFCSNTYFAQLIVGECRIAPERTFRRQVDAVP